MPSISDDWNRVLNQTSNWILDSPKLGGIAALNPNFVGAEANRRAAIDARYPQPTETERLNSAAFRPARMDISTPPPAQIQPSISTPTVTTREPPSNLSPVRDLRGISAMDQGNGGTVKDNVAAINRQTDALRSLHEARMADPNVGAFHFGQTGTTPDPFARPGDSFGDSQMRAAQYESILKDMTGPGIGGRQRAAMGQAAQGLLAPGIAAMQQQYHADDMASRERTAALGLQSQQAQHADEMALRQQHLGIEQMNANTAQAAGQQQGILRGLDIDAKQRILALHDRLNASTDDKERFALSQQIQQLSGHNPQLNRVTMIDVPNPDAQAALLQPTIKRPYDMVTNTMLEPQPAKGGTPSNGIPSADVEWLKKNPDKAAAFDQQYGAGSAARALGR